MSSDKLLDGNSKIGGKSGLLKSGAKATTYGGGDNLIKMLYNKICNNEPRGRIDKLDLVNELLKNEQVADMLGVDKTQILR